MTAAQIVCDKHHAVRCRVRGGAEVLPVVERHGEERAGWSQRRRGSLDERGVRVCFGSRGRCLPVEVHAVEPKLATEQKLLRDALLALPQELQDAIDCVYFRAMSVQETADKLGWPPGTVKSRLFAARKRLREALPEGGLL